MTAPPWLVSAPDAFACFDRAEALAAGAIDPALLGPVRRAVAGALGHPAELERSPVPRTPNAGDRRVTPCVDFAEQFVVDVAAVSDGQRAALGSAMGADTLVFVQALYVVDVFQRGRIALERLFGEPYGGAPTPVRGDLWASLEEFMRVVALATALDPVGTELVRLRGARAHNCRVCQSRRSVKAVDAAGDTAVFEPDADAPSVREQVALDLVDVLVTQPALIGDDLVARVHEVFTPAEITEIVLDVVRNGANKIAVGLAGDAPVVSEGIEFYDIDTCGDVVADVDRDVVRAATS